MEPSQISGRTLLTAIFGDPVAHSMSPVMHNAAYAALGMERAYVPMRVAPERLRDALRAIAALGILGVNLTVPHKERAARMMASLSGEARTLGAINCVVNRDGSLHGDNTDARGLEMDLREAEIDLSGRLAIVVGAGGAAAAALLAIMRLGATRIALCNRTPRRAVRLARRFIHVMAAHGLARGAIEARGLEALADGDLISGAAIVINATPMGLKTGGFTDMAYDAAGADCIFYDMVYARDPTPFLAPALARGLRSLDGAGMLANQGVLAFELFNEVAPPAGVMRAALMAALGRSELPVTRPR